MDGKFKFGEWLPDQPDLDNPGLTECKNTLRVAGNYVEYLPLLGSGTAVSQAVLKAFRASGTGGTNVYVGASDGSTATKLYVGSGSGAASWTDKSPVSALTAATTTFSFAQYNENVIATNYVDNPQYHTLGGSGVFTQLTGTNGAAPKARVVGIIGQFAMLGNLSTYPYAVQWSGLNDITNWPTPGGATAIAALSGIEYLKPEMGAVLGITAGDQWGVILMNGGLYRVTYVGGDVVFQFDTINRAPGAFGQNAWIKVGNLIYYAAPTGFYVTDGTGFKSIGLGKCDSYFISNFDQNYPNNLHCGVHYTKRLIYWTFPKTGNSGVPNEMLVYNYEEDKWTHVSDTVRTFVSGEEALFYSYGVEAFDTSNKCGVFVGTVGTATLTTGEVELNPGGHAFVGGVRPQVSGTSPGVTVKVGHRDDQGSSVTYTSSLTPDSFTGIATSEVDARYHRAEIDIAGPFTQAIGGEFISTPTGAV